MDTTQQQVLDYASKRPLSERRWHVGALVYTPRILVSVFFWMLWGDFCFTMMEQVLPTLLPVQLNELGAPNWVVGLLTVSMPKMLNTVVTPVVSYRSDRYRSRLGRRIPFLLFPTPLIAVFMAMTGFAEPIGRWLHSALSPMIDISPTVTVIVVIAIAASLFQFFDLFVASVYWYLVNDVIPQPVMGRFYGWVRMVGYASAFVFNRYLLGLAESHRAAVYVGVGIFYCFAFMLMCWRVKEGEYPPPPEESERAGLVGNVKIYFRECFTTRFYIWFYLSSAAFMVAWVSIRSFQILFAKSLGMSLGDYGRVMAWTMLLGAALSLPLGWICDRIKPLRLLILSATVMPVVAALNFLFIHGPASFLIGTLGLYTATYLYGSANGPLFPALLPPSKFGQFCSAASIFTAGFSTLAGLLAGFFLDWAGNYQYIYAWFGFFSILLLLTCVPLYRGWIRYGGPDKYAAPDPGERKRDPVAVAASKDA
jgi:MFS family permease